MPTGTSERMHLHVRSRQFFYVRRGTLTIERAGEVHELAAGQGVEVSPSTPHRVHNTSGDTVDFLVISQPPSHGDRQNL